MLLWCWHPSPTALGWFFQKWRNPIYSVPFSWMALYRERLFRWGTQMTSVFIWKAEKSNNGMASANSSNRIRAVFWFFIPYFTVCNFFVKYNRFPHFPQSFPQRKQTFDEGLWVLLNHASSLFVLSDLKRMYVFFRHYFFNLRSYRFYSGENPVENSVESVRNYLR